MSSSLKITCTGPKVPQHSKCAAILSHARVPESRFKHWHRQWTLCPEVTNTLLWRTLMTSSVIHWDQRGEISYVLKSVFRLCCLRPVRKAHLCKEASSNQLHHKNLNNYIMLKSRIIFHVFTLYFFFPFPFYVSLEPRTCREQNKERNRKTVSMLGFFPLPNHGLNNYTIHYMGWEKWD